jgi:hypothetical protein
MRKVGTRLPQGQLTSSRSLGGHGTSWHALGRIYRPLSVVVRQTCAASHGWVCARSRSTRPACATGHRGLGRDADPARSRCLRARRRGRHIRSGGRRAGYEPRRRQRAPPRDRRGRGAQHDLGGHTRPFRNAGRQAGHDRHGHQQLGAVAPGAGRTDESARKPGIRHRQPGAGPRASVARHGHLGDHACSHPRPPEAGRAAARGCGSHSRRRTHRRPDRRAPSSCSEEEVGW